MMAFKKIILLSLLAVCLIFVFACEKGKKAKENIIKESGKTISNAISSDVERGKALFNDVNFAGSSKSCNLCHPNGKRLEKAADNDNLEEDINFCIENHFRGKTIDPKSKEMVYIIAYIKSLKK